jgi:lectin-like protein
VSFIIAGARGDRCTPPPSRPERSRGHRWYRWSLSVAWAATGCTLTAESFEPRTVDPTLLDGAPVVSGLLPVPAEGPLGTPVTSSPSGETGTGEGFAPLAPPEPVGDDVGGSNEPAEAADVDLDIADADGDAELGTPEVATPPDAGAPVQPATPLPPCSTLTFEGSCYEVFAEFVTWDVAEQRCIAWGGHLASVTSSEEDDFLADWPDALGIIGQDGTGIWLGGTEAPGEEDFRWAADDLPLAFENWGSNQPDNGAGVDCIEKRNDGTATWYDRRCTDSQRYACERPF